MSANGNGSITISQLRKKAKDNPRVFFENYNCKIIYASDEIIIAIPLDWECAVFFNSFNCGGEGARWCIGSNATSYYWNDNLLDDHIFLFVYFVEKHKTLGRKVMIKVYTDPDREYDLYFNIYLQDDTIFMDGSITSDDIINNFFRTAFEIDDKVKKLSEMELSYYKLWVKERKKGFIFGTVLFDELGITDSLNELIKKTNVLMSISEIIVNEVFSFDIAKVKWTEMEDLFCTIYKYVDTIEEDNELTVEEWKDFIYTASQIEKKGTKYDMEELDYELSKTSVNWWRQIQDRNDLTEFSSSEIQKVLNYYRSLLDYAIHKDASTLKTFLCEIIVKIETECSNKNIKLL
ncbi:hypothetical protein AGMMS50212_05320 [Spirochaetia bacterium]|nr:hypothetical protein AGMMS50212_05320 [Spirochaetia bacterium]